MRQNTIDIPNDLVQRWRKKEEGKKTRTKEVKQRTEGQTQEQRKTTDGATERKGKKEGGKE